MGTTEMAAQGSQTGMGRGQLRPSCLTAGDSGSLILVPLNHVRAPRPLALTAGRSARRGNLEPAPMAQSSKAGKQVNWYLRSFTPNVTYIAVNKVLAQNSHRTEKNEHALSPCQQPFLWLIWGYFICGMHALPCPVDEPGGDPLVGLVTSVPLLSFLFPLRIFAGRRRHTKENGGLEGV